MAETTTSGDDLHATVAQRLKADGQRYTTSRRALVSLLASIERPMTIGELLDRERGLAQSSAYRNLAVLERAGVVHRIVTNDEFARFELAEHLTEHHHHLICSSCGRVEDFTISPQLEVTLDHTLHDVAARWGFDAHHHTLDLVGTCTSCT